MKNKKMKTKKIVCLLLFFIIFYSCKHDDGMLKASEVNNIKSEIINKGDKYAYTELLMYYDKKKEFESILPYSLIMAYRYNYSYAYFEAYVTILKIYNKGQYNYALIKNLDAKSKEFAFTHLKKSAELGNISAKKVLIIYYLEGKYLPKNIELAKKYEDEIKIR